MQDNVSHISAYLARTSRTTASFPRVPQADICPVCKMPMKDGVINHVSGGYDWQHMKTVLKPCPKCSIETANREAVRRETETIIRVFGDAQIPWRAQSWEFSNYPADADQKAKALVMAFVQRHLAGDRLSKRMCFLGGATGRCKTSLALCALKEALKAGKTGLYVMTAELMLKLQSSFRDGSDFTQDQLLSAVTSVEWLVLDDLAVESGQDSRVSAYTLKSLYLIIQKRADKGLYTIITSNLSLKDLEAYWRPSGLAQGQFHEGLRIIERLREFCEGCTVSGRNQRG